MNEFLKLKWRPKDISELEPQRCFITEDVLSDSLIYKYFQNKRIITKVLKKRPRFFEEKEYIPGNNLRLVTFKKSSLDGWAHEHCLKALKVFQSGKDPSCFTTNEQFFVEIFKKLKSKIIEENSKYETFVLNEWNRKDKLNLLRIMSSIFLYGKKVWENKWKQIVLYPQLYKEQSTFNMNFNENESIVDFRCVNNVLELGTLARFSKPILKSACLLKCVNLPSLEENHSVYSNLPVSRDQNIPNILQHHDVDLVISASSLKCITDTSDMKRRWIIPFVVKSVTIEKEGTTVSKKVVFLDKPFSQNDISKVDLAYISFKNLVKTNFCQCEAFNYDNQDSTLKQRDAVDYESAFVENGTFRPPKRHHNRIHHNANYRIWNIKKTDCQNNLMKNKSETVEFNVLIRSKLDACECNDQGALQPVIVKPKLEMQLKYGANIPAKSELAREWTSLFFTPFSNLYRVRLSPLSGEVICLEKCNIQKITTEAQTHYKYKPQLGLGILQKVFEEVLKLEPGNYLLQHLPKHEAFIAILKQFETSDSNQDVFDFHAEYDQVHLRDLPKNWLPIDVNYILPSFDAIKRLPGMFTPRILKEKKGQKKQGRGSKMKPKTK